MKIGAVHRQFWRECPALLFGLSLLIGTGSFLFWERPWNWVWPLIFGFYLLWMGYRPAAVLMGLGVGYAWLTLPQMPPVEKGYFSISSLKPYASPFDKGLLYQGVFYAGGQKIACSVRHPDIKERPKADCDYLLRGQLIPRNRYEAFFKAKEWIRIENTRSLAEFRFRMKEGFRAFLNRKFQTAKAASLFGALITGDLEDRALRYEFGRIGLQHLLAISGFHFAVLIGFCSSFLKLFLSSRWRYFILLAAITAYFFFIGPTPSVQRSWVTASLYLCAKLMRRHTTGMNLVGASLLIEILLDPSAAGQIGFQLSFLSCAGILLLSPIFERFVQYWLPRRDPATLTRWAQHGYLISRFFRKAIVISLSVNAAILPLLLFHFHSFPWLSIAYNLFVPFFLGGSLFCLLASLCAEALFAPLGTLFFSATQCLAVQLLEIVSYPPAALDYSIQISHFPAPVIPIYLFSLFTLAHRSGEESPLSEGNPFQRI